MTASLLLTIYRSVSLVTHTFLLRKFAFLLSYRDKGNYEKMKKNENNMKAIRRMGDRQQQTQFGQPLGVLGLWMSGCSPSPPNSQSQANTKSD